MESLPTIRRARSEDAAEIAACVTAAYNCYVARIGNAPAPMLADYNEVVQQQDVFVLVSATSIIGLLVLVKQAQSVLIDNVAVHPVHQGRGFGQQLMALAEREARNLGLDKLTLYTNELMTETIEFYLRLGFVETDRRIEHGYRRVYMQKLI